MFVDYKDYKTSAATIGNWWLQHLNLQSSLTFFLGKISKIFSKKINEVLFKQFHYYVISTCASWLLRNLPCARHRVATGTHVLSTWCTCASRTVLTVLVLPFSPYSSWDFIKEYITSLISIWMSLRFIMHFTGRTFFCIIFRWHNFVFGIDMTNIYFSSIGKTYLCASWNYVSLAHESTINRQWRYDSLRRYDSYVTNVNFQDWTFKLHILKACLCSNLPLSTGKTQIRTLQLYLLTKFEENLYKFLGIIKERSI